MDRTTSDSFFITQDENKTLWIVPNGGTFSYSISWLMKVVSTTKILMIAMVVSVAMMMTTMTLAIPACIRSSFGIEQKRWGAEMTAAIFA